MHTKTGQTLVFKERGEKEKKKEAVQTHSHTIVFHQTLQLTRLKKKHKNKLHKYFLPRRLFFPPCFLVSRAVVFVKSVFVLCSAGGFGVVPCPLGFFLDTRLRLSCLTPHILGQRRIRARRSKRSPSPIKVIPETTLTRPPLCHRKYQGPLHENIRWDFSPCLPKQVVQRSGTERVCCMSMHTYVHTPVCECVCMRVYVRVK